MELCELPIVSLSNPSQASISLRTVPDKDMQSVQSPLTYLFWTFINHDLWLLWMLLLKQHILLLLHYTIIADQYPAAPCVQIVCKSRPPPLYVPTFILRNSKSIILLYWISTHHSVRLWAHVIDGAHHRGVRCNKQ